MKRIFVAGFLFGLCCQSLATASPISNSNYTQRFYLGAGAGDMFFRVGNNNYLSTGLGWPNDYYSANSISNQGYGFLAAGFAWERDSELLPIYSLGLRYMYVRNTSTSGYVEQYSMPEFKNYTYSYDTQILSLLAIAKANIVRWNWFMPYVLAGAGIATFGTSNYEEQPLGGVTPRVSPGFGDGSGNNFAYQVGVGFDIALLENLLINLEYDYINFGTISTGTGADYPTLTGTNYDNESLKNKIDATTLFVGLTYFVD